MITEEEIEVIASRCHHVNMMYCKSLGDYSQSEWEHAPQWQKDSAINGVKFHLENPDVTPEQSHENWLREKVADGWVYGDLKDVEKKTHPCCLPYDQLPEEQKMKDQLFSDVINIYRTMLCEQS